MNVKLINYLDEFKKQREEKKKILYWKKKEKVKIGIKL